MAFECAGLASESWIWFGKCRNYCVDTSWPPESSMHPTRGAYWLSSLQDSLPSCNPEHRFHCIFLHWWKSLICPINSNSDHLCPSVFHSACLVVWGRQEITLSINIDTGQLIPQLWHKKLRPSDLMFCWHLWEPGITCDTYSRQLLSMGFSWWSFSFCAHKNNIS